MIDHIDILEIITGTPSHKKAVVKEKSKQEENEKKSQTGKLRSQQVLQMKRLFILSNPISSLSFSSLSI
jgi:hypothetical protein